MVCWLLLLIPLILLLHHFGILSSNISAGIGGNWGASTHWRGNYSFLSGSISKKLMVPRGFDTLSIRIATNSGSLELEILDRAGMVLYECRPASSFTARVNVDGIKSCTIHLKASDFNGKFHMQIQK